RGAVVARGREEAKRAGIEMPQRGGNRGGGTETAGGTGAPGAAGGRGAAAGAPSTSVGLSGGAEDAVARVAQARHDVAMLVQAVVDGRGVDMDVRVLGQHRVDADRRCHQHQRADFLA
ncbi:hypothetical protein OY671_012086, partial [Metschnikowia pulcherrima]